MDSRVAARLVRLLKGVRLPVCTGSDLTAQLLATVVQPADRIVMIGGSDAQAQQITAKYGLTNLRHYDPPMGFIHDASPVGDRLSLIQNADPFPIFFLAG